MKNKIEVRRDSTIGDQLCGAYGRKQGPGKGLKSAEYVGTKKDLEFNPMRQLANRIQVNQLHIRMKFCREAELQT